MKTVVVKRILRHKQPVLIFPYFTNSREQEIVDELIKDYNSDLITRLPITSVKNIKNYL